MHVACLLSPITRSWQNSTSGEKRLSHNIWQIYIVTVLMLCIRKLTEIDGGKKQGPEDK